MKGKGFFALLVAVLVLGAALGGTFVGGIALGKTQSDNEVAGTTSVPGQRFQGQLSQEQLDQFRQQFQDSDRQSGGLPAFGGGRGGSGLAGSIERIEGNIITVTTAQGPLQATIGDDTTIQVFNQGNAKDLEAGLQVTVVGQRGEDGTVEAQTIVVNPPRFGGFGGGRFPGGRGGGGITSP